VRTPAVEILPNALEPYPSGFFNLLVERHNTDRDALGAVADVVESVGGVVSGLFNEP